MSLLADYPHYRPLVGPGYLPLFDRQLAEGAAVIDLAPSNLVVHGWSSELADMLEDMNGEHFIDIYNRRLMMQGLAPALAQPDCEYIDIGCSSGYMMRDVKEAYPHVSVSGCDYEAHSLEHCHRRFPHFPLFKIDLTDCAFADESFHAITCLNVLEHIREDTRALAELFRIMKPGALLGITVPLGPRLFDYYDEVHCHCLRYDLRELEDKVRAAGFRVVKANCFASFIYPAFYTVKRLNQWMYRHYSIEEKHRLATRQAVATGSPSLLMGTLCRIEETIGRKIRYPAGIRGYIVAMK